MTDCRRLAAIWSNGGRAPGRSTKLVVMRTIASILGCFTLTCLLAADEPAPIAVWNFGSEEATPLKMHGDVQRDQAGPRPPEYPDFADDNTAIRLGGKGFLSIEDPGAESDFDFSNGDAITLEAWVNVAEARSGSPMYVIGKGRTGSPKFARDNQNWAMRVVSSENTAKISFLFASSRGAGDSHWHRWTSEAGFLLGTGWHHLAVAYRFGTPESIQGWIDGRPTTGSWDMGGQTDKEPVVDNDAVWIGSSQGGSAGNSFRGGIDAVAIHRSILSNEVIASRFRRVGGPRVVAPSPEVMPEIEHIPDTRVLVTFSEGLPSMSRWLLDGERWPDETDRWLTDKFLLPRVPVRHDDWGIRASWKSPLLVRMAADVELPPVGKQEDESSDTDGQYRFLLRARSLSRLWVDGKLVARTTKNPRRRSNLEPIVPVAKPPMPGGRSVPFAQQEVFGQYEAAGSDDDARNVRVVLELVVGGKDHRTETGEVCVAVQPPGSDAFEVLWAGDADTRSRLLLTDEAIEPALVKIERLLQQHDDEKRRAAAATQDEFWRHRHQLARQATAAPAEPARDGKANPIDDFVADKIQRAISQSQQYNQRATEYFHSKVLPILREQCFRCHGQKDQGGLRLNSRQAVLKSGESELPAVVPGDPDASEMIVRIRDGDMPPTDTPLGDEEISILENWIRRGAIWPAPPIAKEAIAEAAIIEDAAFLRRVYLDTIGIPPSQQEAEAFLASEDPGKRSQLIDQLLEDRRYADHWISFWLDLLAENPTLLNASLNSTGPFRWFLYDSLRDAKPLDRMVTELILMRGSPHDGGSAGFGLAAENDSPMAAKSHILASGLLGIELQCARCHDSPYHSTTQEDLYSLAAMLARKQLAPPKTSRVPDAFFEQKQRESLIRVSLELGQQVKPKWPLAEYTGIEDTAAIDALMQDPDDMRERFAALVTSGDNRRFPQVMVNHLWKRLIGAGLVEPAGDWEGREASHPALLDWLAGQLVRHGYDFKHVMRLIMNSQLYQREGIGVNLQAAAGQRFFNAPDPRRLTAEQVVDSLFASTGRSMDVEELTFVHDGLHPSSKRLTLGKPRRAWMFASLNNERDRPSLSMPRAQAVVDVLESFGWNGSRQKPISQRETDPNVLQPGILANGNLTMSLTRASHGSLLAQLAIDAASPDRLLETLFLRFLARDPNETECKTLGGALAAGFDSRLLPPDQVRQPRRDRPLPQVTWTNHLVAEANEIQLEIERRVRRGPPADPRLNPDWREVYEDVVWSLVNHREFVWVP